MAMPFASSTAPVLPASSISRRFTMAPGPWVHGGLQKGTLDVECVANDLATKVDPDDPELVDVFRRFFSSISKLNEQCLDLKSCAAELQSHQRFDEVLHHLGLMTVEYAPEKVNPRVQAWITTKFVPIALADRLAWIAQPTNHAPPVAPNFPAQIPPTVRAHTSLSRSFINRRVGPRQDGRLANLRSCCTGALVREP
jgi:hypothetical protein